VVRFSRDDDSAMVMLTTDELIKNCSERQTDVRLAVSVIKISDIRTADDISSPNSTTVVSVTSA